MNPGNRARVMREAANYIERHGHHKGSYREGYETGDPVERGPQPDGPSCVFGAIGMVMRGRFTAADEEGYAVGEVARTLRNWLNETHLDDWNDDPKTTPEMVTAALRGCAASEQSLQRHMDREAARTGGMTL